MSQFVYMIAKMAAINRKYIFEFRHSHYLSVFPDPENKDPLEFRCYPVYKLRYVYSYIIFGRHLGFLTYGFIW